MAGSLRVVHLKLMRAEEHLHALKSEVARFREIEPYEEIKDRDSDPDALLLTIKARSFPQARWSVLIGDFIHNLRSALDLLANQLVKAADNEPITEGRSSDRTQFPILNIRPDANRKKKGKAVIRGGVSESAAAIVDALQPYTWDDPTLHPLAIIREMSNKDKHRQVNVFLSFIPFIETSLDTGDLDALFRQMHVGPVVVERTYRFPYEGRFTREVEMNVHYTPKIIPGERWVGEDEGDAIALLAYLFEYVCQSVVGRFKSVCFPGASPLHLATPFPVQQRRRIGRTENPV